MISFFNSKILYVFILITKNKQTNEYVFSSKFRLNILHAGMLNNIRNQYSSSTQLYHINDAITRPKKARYPSGQKSSDFHGSFGIEPQIFHSPYLQNLNNFYKVEIKIDFFHIIPNENRFGAFSTYSACKNQLD